MDTIKLRKNELGSLRPEPTMNEQVLNRFWEEALKNYDDKPLQIVNHPEDTTISSYEGIEGYLSRL
ncbi:Acetyl xylan esterase [Paenibacillus vortex V453]|uniref:Acetyl xylan esterase n=1 Tax=Paenibacillus vortex V453 TaxID=715225 RepID=A0A2R9SXB3_9BACL|nr:hypothetical protein [Paenibacillus vortex]EFU41987.1 Acetyl xylan esterase [Paenibacillus vortex V453]